MKQERAEGVTDFDKQPLEIFLEEADITQQEFETSLASGSTLEISGECLHKVLQTDIGMRLLQDNALSTSSKFETDGMDSLLTYLYQQKKMEDNASQAVDTHIKQTENANADFDEYSEYTLKNEVEMSPEEFAEVQKVQAYMDGQVKAYSEENYFTQQIASDIEENTMLTDTPYSLMQSRDLANAFMGTIKTYAENYNLPLQDAYNKLRPYFLGDVATTQDVDSLVSRMKQEAGLANFNKEAIQTENTLYQQEAEVKLNTEIAEWENFVSELEHRPRNSVLMLKQTPLVMHLIGADFKELYASPHVFDGMFPGEQTNPNLNIHLNIDDNVLKQIPQALTDPIAVYRNPKNGDRFTFLTDLQDKHSAYVAVAIEFDATHDRAEVNLAVTAYAKNDKNGKPVFDWFVNNGEFLVYVNRDKDKIFWKKNRQQLSQAVDNMNGVMSAGANSLWDVSRSYKLNVKDESDLVKLKEQYPTFYHDNTIIQGSITPVEGAKSIIRFFKATDISTGFHEFGHYMRFVMKQKADLENARTQDIEDWKTACEFVGAKEGEVWTTGINLFVT